MNGQAIAFDAYHIMPKNRKTEQEEKKQKIARIDFDTPHRRDRETVHIDEAQVEAFRRASRHDQKMEYLLSSLFAIISITAIVAFVISF